MNINVVQIIQINLVLKNYRWYNCRAYEVQIIQINLVLKNVAPLGNVISEVQIIQINLVLKNGLIQHHHNKLFK